MDAQKLTPNMIRIVEKKFPIKIEILKTECDSMTSGYDDSLLFRRSYYNDYCLLSIRQISKLPVITLFHSDHKNFERIENDYLDGIVFIPNNDKEISIIIKTLV